MPAFIFTRCPGCSILLKVDATEGTPIRYRIVECLICGKNFNAWDHANDRSKGE